jgi:hypothetical protein
MNLTVLDEMHGISNAKFKKEEVAVACLKLLS